LNKGTIFLSNWKKTLNGKFSLTQKLGRTAIVTNSYIFSIISINIVFFIEKMVSIALEKLSTNSKLSLKIETNLIV